MALKTLKGVKEIGGFKVMRESDREKYKDSDGNIDWGALDKARDKYPIHISDNMNAISFRVQNGPIKENGVNGCQVDTIVEAAKKIIEGLNEKFPCRENSMVITKLDEALMWSKKRTEDRTKRGVEWLDKI